VKVAALEEAEEADGVLAAFVATVTGFSKT